MARKYRWHRPNNVFYKGNEYRDFRCLIQGGSVMRSGPHTFKAVVPDADLIEMDAKKHFKKRCDAKRWVEWVTSLIDRFLDENHAEILQQMKTKSASQLQRIKQKKEEAK